MDYVTLQTVEAMFAGIYPGHSDFLCNAMDSKFMTLEEGQALNNITRGMHYTVYYEFNFTLACLLLLDAGEEIL